MRKGRFSHEGHDGLSNSSGRNLAGCTGEGRRQFGHRQSAPQHGDCASCHDNPLLGKIVGERLYERSYLNAYRSVDHLSRNLSQGTTRSKRPRSAITDNTKNDNRFRGRRIIQWRTNDCVTAAFLKDEVVSRPQLQV
jgi:hypothetical protein